MHEDVAHAGSQLEALAKLFVEHAVLREVGKGVAIGVWSFETGGRREPHTRRETPAIRSGVEAP